MCTSGKIVKKIDRMCSQKSDIDCSISDTGIRSIVCESMLKC